MRGVVRRRRRRWAHARDAFLSPVMVAFSNFSGVVWKENVFLFSSVDEKHLMCFPKETSVTFLPRSVDGALLVNEGKASEAIAPVVP